MRLWFRMTALAIAVLLTMATSAAYAFCGFYAAQANTKLYNNSSRVVLARDGDDTVVTMAADYTGSPSNFAMVVPVPVVPQRGQIRVSDSKLIDHIDSYSAPRLVEYHDPDPCARPRYYGGGGGSEDGEIVVTGAAVGPSIPPKFYGVKVEARYEVGEYDILILSALQSDGLVSWLTDNGYQLPPAAAPTIASYLKQNMKFFVAKVNLGRRASTGPATLRPLQISYASHKFMLPIRLGTVNANGPQELFVFTLTRNGRVETTNYRTVKLKSDLNIPVYVKGRFSSFYQSLFDQQVREENMSAVFLEYAWNSSSCDPCSGKPLDRGEARALGAGWPDGAPVFVTRLHLRYTAATFPEDLMLQETRDYSNFQGRYIVTYPYNGDSNCSEARDYYRGLVDRWTDEAKTLADATGWDKKSIRSNMRRSGAWPKAAMTDDRPWYAALWNSVSAWFST